MPPFCLRAREHRVHEDGYVRVYDACGSGSRRKRNLQAIQPWVTRAI
jgi:hypothetical protein